jgi:hypothetical protein
MTIANFLGHRTKDEDLAALKELVGMSACNGNIARVVEIGSYVGQTAMAMVEGGGLLWCIDHWKGSTDRMDELYKTFGEQGVFETFCKNVGPELFVNIFPCRGRSDQWASVWPFKADMVFIDGDHEYESVKYDIKAWFPHVRDGGILCGHDYGYFKGVNKAVDEFGKDGVKGDSVWFKVKNNFG